MGGGGSQLISEHVIAYHLQDGIHNGVIKEQESLHVLPAAQNELRIGTHKAQKGLPSISSNHEEVIT